MAASQLRSWRLPRAVSYVQNLYDALIVANLVVNQNRGVHQFTYLRPFAGDMAYVRKTGEQIHMVE